MRVLHLAHGRVYGGIERVLTTLAAERDGAPLMEPEFALCFCERPAAEVRAAGCLVHDLEQVRASRPWTVFRAQRALARLLEDRKIDVVAVHGNWCHGLFGGVVRKKGLPLVAIAHAHYRSSDWTERLARYRGAQLILANSQFTLASVGAAFPNVTRKLWRYPVGPSSKNPCKDKRRNIRHALNVQATDVVVMMASRLDRYKGHEILIDAVQMLRSSASFTSLKVWIVGGPQTVADRPRYIYLKQRVEHAGLQSSVHFLGQRNDVHELMEAADLFCQPNIGAEPFGVVFVEALWASLPVVTSAIGGGAEVVDKTCGRLTPPGDAPALSCALQQLIENPAERFALASNGPLRAAALCDPVRQVGELYAHLRQVLDANAPSGVGRE